MFIIFTLVNKRCVYDLMMMVMMKYSFSANVSQKKLTQLNEHLWTQVRVKHLSVHIYLVTSVYQVLQSAWFTYWPVADSGQLVGRKIIYNILVHQELILHWELWELE